MDVQTPDYPSGVLIIRFRIGIQDATNCFQTNLKTTVKAEINQITLKVGFVM
jgi:hypothetical protein